MAINPVFYLGIADLSEEIMSGIAGRGFSFPEAQLVECISGYYRLKKTPTDDGKVLVVMAASRLPNDITYKEMFLPPADDWTEFTICAGQGAVGPMADMNMAAIGFTVLGDDPDANFEFYLDALHVSKVTNIKDHPQQSELHLYPNPVGDVLTIPNSTNEDLHWEVFSLSGKELLAGKGSEVKVESLPSGSYLLRLNNGMSYKFSKN